MRIAKPDTLSDLGTLGLSLAESKQLLAGIQREIVAAQARVHAVHRPACRGCGAAYRVKDYRHHAIVTPFSPVPVRLPRFRCAGCGAAEAGVEWPSHARSTPELDRLRAQISALMTYRTAAEELAQLFPVDAGSDPETLRCCTFKTGLTPVEWRGEIRASCGCTHGDPFHAGPCLGRGAIADESMQNRGRL